MDPPSHEINLLLAFEGSPLIVDIALKEALDACLQYGGMSLPSDKSTEFWDTRHDSAIAYQATVHLSPAERRARHSSWRKDYLHVTLPPSLLLAYREKCKAITNLYGNVVTEWSVWGRPEFFSFIVGEPQLTDNQCPSMDAIIDELLLTALEFGGTIEYCHGVGLKLSHLIHKEQGSKQALIQRLKYSLDPHNILNPGKLGYSYPGTPYTE